MQRAYAQVREFQAAFGQPVGDRPRYLSDGCGPNALDNGVVVDLAARDVIGMANALKDRTALGFGGRVLLRAGLLTEEIGEFIGAKTVTDQVDAMIDVIYIALGTLVEMGVQPEPIFNIVHAANMSKLGPDGKPIVINGKVRKPEGWTAPEPLIADELERQRTQLLH